MNKADEIINYSIKKRGEILHQCIMLEKKIDSFFSNYFCKDPNKRLLFFYIFMDKISLDSKISMLESLLNKISTNELKTSYKELISDLREIKDDRNRFAHYMVDVISDQSIDNFPKAINLVSFKNSTRLFNYDDDKLKNLIDKINNCSSKLSGLIAEVKN